MFQHLLVPLDGSRLAEVALPWALYLAEAFGARVTLLHIQEQRAPRTVHGEPHLTESVAAAEYLDGVIASFLAGVQADRHIHSVAEGDMAASIARHSGELGTDLAVLTAHGRPGVRTMLLGSIAQQVLRQAPMPVLLLRPEPAAQSPRLEALLVPLDGAPAAETALPFATGLALTVGARVRLLLVVPTVGTLRDERAAAARISPLGTAEVLAIEEEHAAAYVQDVAARMRQQGIAVSAEVARGNVLDVVVEAAKEVDLVVMASHGRSGLAALWSASIGSGVQARAETPLLLLNPSRQGLTPPPPGQLEDAPTSITTRLHGGLSRPSWRKMRLR
jgi:nucleotide-binding universal stress UspA family protein